jgi:hypothetical protein
MNEYIEKELEYAMQIYTILRHLPLQNALRVLQWLTEVFNEEAKEILKKNNAGR